MVDAGALLLADELLRGDDSASTPRGQRPAAALVIAAVSIVLQVLDRHQRRRRIRPQGRAAGRATAGGKRPTDVAGIIFLEIDGLALPVLRNAMRDGSAPNDGPMGRRARLPPHRVGARSLIPDGREPGGHPAGVQRGHSRFPVGGEGGRAVDQLLDAGRLRRDRAAPGVGRGAADGGRRQPGKPALGGGRRGDPDGQPDGGRAKRQPRIPGVPRQRVQRHPGARVVRVGGAARVDGRDPGGATRRTPPRPPRRDLPGRFARRCACWSGT